MRTAFRVILCGSLLISFLMNVIPCGPSFVSPVFDINSSPEFPYEDFAAGKLGIIRPAFHRSVLFAAYRYLNGGGFNPDEQKALTEIWRAEFRKEAYGDSDISEAVKAWVEKRKEAADKEEKLPAIYAERDYGGYEFFPNCTRNAFETAAETLSDRVSSYGSDDRNVKDWLRGQDAVFSNCASGKTSPEEINAGMPLWLQKDRAYQLAAASFYSMDYEDAKRRFREIAGDPDSPWRETADYLVARTLVRQGSVGQAPDKAAEFYSEAERHLNNFASSGGKFNDAADRLMGLIKYRTRPDERARELAQKLASYGGPNFRQDVIDYVWLLDKFERLAYEAAEKKRLAEKLRSEGITDLNTTGELTSEQSNMIRRLRELNGEELPNSWASRDTGTQLSQPQNATDLEVRFYSTDYTQSWSFYVPIDATDEEAIAEADKLLDVALTDEMKNRIREARQAAYSSRFSNGIGSSYEGGYYSDEPKAMELIPAFLRDDDLTDWLFTYQIGGSDAYLYSLNRYKQTGAEIWLLTALSKADHRSAEADRLLEAASRTSRSSVAYPTVAFHAARIHMEMGRSSNANAILDEALIYSASMPMSSVNQFMQMKQRLSFTLDDFLRYAQRKPFAFDYGGSIGSIDEFVAEQKAYYNPEYHKDGREAYYREVEENFRAELEWQGRVMFDHKTVSVINQFFPQTLILQAQRSAQLPDYLRERFAIAAWTRAALLGDHAGAAKIAPELVRYRPELAEGLKFIEIAQTPAAKSDATLYFVIKNPMLTPFIEDGLGKTDNTADVWDLNDWWCEQYDDVYDEVTGESVSRSSLPRPAFLTQALFDSATAELARLKEIGDAPKYLAQASLEWARRAPRDRRVTEALYLMHKANGWSKWGCGSNFELQKEIGDLMRARYPSSPWTRQLAADELANQ